MRGSNIHAIILVLLICASAVIDTTIIRISTSIGGLSASPLNLAFFIYMFVLFAYGQFALLRFVKEKNLKLQNHQIFYKIKLSILERSVILIQYTLISILAIFLIQILVYQSYLLIFLKYVVFISYVSSGIILGLLTYRLIGWLKFNRNAVGLIYCLAMATLAANSFLAFTYLTTEYSDNAPIIKSVRSLTGVFATPDVTLQPTYIIISVCSYILTWAASVSLLRNYSSKLGRMRFWILVAIPLVYFLSQFQSIFFYTFSEFRTAEPVLFGIVYNLFFSATKPVGALLFGLGFWSISKRIQNRVVQDYLLISACGISLIFTANQPLGLVYAPYPPFGLVTICFMALASYLFYLGIFSVSISVSQDRKVRQSIRHATIRESTKFLDSIGTAEMVHDIERKVISITQATRDSMERETGISSSVEYDDMNKYLQEVLQELKNKGDRKDRDPLL